MGKKRWHNIGNPIRMCSSMKEWHGNIAKLKMLTTLRLLDIYNQTTCLV